LFPENLSLSRGEVKGNIEIRGKQNSQFPKGPVEAPVEAALANFKMECQRWQEKPSILGRSGIQYVAMVTKLSSSYCGAH